MEVDDAPPPITNDDIWTRTREEQGDLEELVEELYESYRLQPADEGLRLLREAHIPYLLRGLRQLGPGYASLDASRPWLCFWIVHSLAILGHELTPVEAADCAAFLQSCQDPSGGFGGGPGQLPHLAATYAAVAALATLGPAALTAVNRPAMAAFLMRQAVPPASGGGFAVHDGGEVDVRGCYTALATAHLLGLGSPHLAQSAIAFVTRCQGFVLVCAQLPEGGLRDKPGKGRDYYHTCYCLAGLALAQHGDGGGSDVLGPAGNVVRPVDPLLNVVKDRLQAWMAAL